MSLVARWIFWAVSRLSLIGCFNAQKSQCGQIMKKLSGMMRIYIVASIVYLTVSGVVAMLHASDHEFFIPTVLP
jgi:hypothetical protein